MRLLQKTVGEIAELSPDELAKLHRRIKLELDCLRAIQKQRGIEIVGESGVQKVKLLGPRRVWCQDKDRMYGWIGLDEMP